MSDKERPVAHAIGLMIGLFANFFVDAWAVMFALSLLHHDAHGVPPLGYWALFWSIVAINWIAITLGYSLRKRA